MSLVSWILAAIPIVGLVGIFAHRIVTRKGFGVRLNGLVVLVVVFPVVAILTVEDVVSSSLFAVLVGVLCASGVPSLLRGLGLGVSDE